MSDPVTQYKAACERSAPGLLWRVKKWPSRQSKVTTLGVSVYTRPDSLVLYVRYKLEPPLGDSPVEFVLPEQEFLEDHEPVDPPGVS